MNKIDNKMIRTIDDFHLQTGFPFLKEKFFRGQRNGWPLLPKVFREDILNCMDNRFPGKKISEWTELAVTEKLLGNINDDMCRRIATIGAFIMQYNYYLSIWVKQNKNRLDSETFKQYQQRRKRSFWTKDESFIWWIGQVGQFFIGRKDLNGQTFQESQFYDAFTAYGEQLPQHYDAPTASLDWSKNPEIALYFALCHSNDSSSPTVYICKNGAASESPFKIHERDLNNSNERMEIQDGVLMRFNDSYLCLFYLHNGYWPSVDEFYRNRMHHTGSCELAISQIKIDPKSRHDLLDYLDKKGINEEALKLNT